MGKRTRQAIERGGECRRTTNHFPTCPSMPAVSLHRVAAAFAPPVGSHARVAPKQERMRRRRLAGWASSESPQRMTTASPMI